jgi:hypothetical protein
VRQRTRRPAPRRLSHCPPRPVPDRTTGSRATPSGPRS